LGELVAENWQLWNTLADAGFPDEPEASRVELRRALIALVGDCANWDASSNLELLTTVQSLTAAAHAMLGLPGNSRPIVFDPFAGGGSIPLEAMRVGAEAYAADLNPVPVLINKVLLDYVPRFGGEKLAEAVRTEGAKLLERAEEKLAPYYPQDSRGKPVSYLWARTARCEGPGCGVELPLIRSLAVASRGANSVYIELVQQGDQLVSKLVTQKPQRAKGTVQRGAAVCPACGFTTPASQVREQLRRRRGGACDARLLAVAQLSKSGGRKEYRLGDETDLAAVELAGRHLSNRLDETPDSFFHEELPYLRSIFNIQLLGVTRWGDLYTPRQHLAVTILIDCLKELGSQLADQGFGRAVLTCLAFAIDRVAAQSTSLCRWQPKGEFVVGTFGRQALGIIWDFAEARPVNGASGDLNGAIDWIARVLEQPLPGNVRPGVSVLAPAQQLPLPTDSAEVMVTDPPYYDAVPYADLSDFFYVILRRSVGAIYPDLFSDELTNKREEIVQLAERNEMYSYKTREHFEKEMSLALIRAREVLIPTGIATIVFAHKETSAWESLLASVLDAGWVVTASWPIDTERAVRMRAHGSAALASSVHLVCRPREDAHGKVDDTSIGDWHAVLRELPLRIHDWLPRLASEGIVGADAIFSCLGPALEVFSRYSRVEKVSGERVSLREYLEHVWATVAKEALSMLFDEADASGFEEDARLTAMWLWTLSTGNANGGSDRDEPSEGEVSATTFALEFDAARKIAQGLGINLEALEHVVEIKGANARLRNVTERTAFLFGKKASESKAGAKRKEQMQLFAELDEEASPIVFGVGGTVEAGKTILDRTHQAMILFAAGRSEALKTLLHDDGIGHSPGFWRYAQALSALYPSHSEEKRWVDGVLAHKKGLGFG
jgi:adenine-specific DNA methylase